MAAKGAYTRFVSHSAAFLRMLSVCLDVLTVIASAACLVTIALYVGHDRQVVSFTAVKPWLHGCQTIFALNIIFNLLLRFRTTIAETKPLKWVIDITLLLSLIPRLWPQPHAPWWPAISSALYSHAALAACLGIYSGIYLSFALIRSLGKHTNPSLILSISFLLFIGIGSAMLMLPKCTVNGISTIDSIFVSTSAVCICGLTPVDVSSTFTAMGQCIIAVMMQVGALGVMTFTSFFALFFSGRASIYSQLMVKDMIYSKTINSLLPTLFYTLLFTMSVEAIGAAAIYWSVVGSIPGYSQADYIIFAVFHSLSAFCNAGFSNIPGGLSNPALMEGNQTVYLTISVLIVAGGIGLPILINAKDALFAKAGKLWDRMLRRPCRPGRPHPYNLNTRVAMISTSALFIITAAAFFILENHNSLEGMSPYEKSVQSIFNAVTPRSAGFSSVNPDGFMPATLILVMFMMWIGGGSQSTAGGIKVNTFAASMLHLKASITGRSKVVVFNRAISTDSLSRASSIVFLSIFSLFIFVFTLILLESEIPVKMLLFEAVSALFAVGSSLGATPLLGPAGKFLVCIAMFVGRVGLLSLLAGLAGRRREVPSLRLPDEDLIIN